MCVQSYLTLLKSDEVQLIPRHEEENWPLRGVIKLPSIRVIWTDLCQQFNKDTWGQLPTFNLGTKRSQRLTHAQPVCPLDGKAKKNCPRIVAQTSSGSASMIMICRCMQIYTSDGTNLRELWGDRGAVAMETSKRHSPPPPAQTSAETQAQRPRGSWLRSPEEHRAAKGVTRKDPSR